ncbi:hypothetical protein J4E90_008475 [Alternaria incomplexa]|uniref:uncharacterized protein n=1 Tax=Alternaria incomplexa TaxID=1187928 RepID=UPI00221F9DD6|nr:uncharacterized protein J4E90_008475 [Alternaria incomplexa]KAI4908740.1 hypothetical protein J4E90_008475 [Alternaria incomplexa]
MYTTPSQCETGMFVARSSLNSVTFVLAGRTTLSEHCPTEHIEVEYAIAERSPYLRIYLPQHVRDDRPLLPIQLGDIDPAGFKLYIEWLTTGAVEVSTQGSLQLNACIDLIYAHIVGSAFSQPNFQDYIIEKLASVLDSAQTFDQKMLAILYLEKHASTLLRRHGRAGEFEQTDKVNAVGGKKWSIDDDPELNAMAAQYLGKATTPSRTDKSSTSLDTRHAFSQDIKTPINPTEVFFASIPNLSICFPAFFTVRLDTALPPPRHTPGIYAPNPQPNLRTSTEVTSLKKEALSSRQHTTRIISIAIPLQVDHSST